MKMTGNTILITGGASGIGLALAEAFMRLGNQVIVAGRSKQKLEAAAQKGLSTAVVDMTNRESIQALAKKVMADYPSLNAVFHNAGIMKNENLRKGGNAAIQEETVLTNILGPMRLTEAVLPHLLQQQNAVILTVSSGLAFTPLAMTPTYSASKAALHSYTQSLRYQLNGTGIQVIELAPPYVQTHLMGDRQANDPHAMPLSDFIAEVLQILKDQPEVKEVLVKRVHPHRFSADGGVEKYENYFKQMNDQVSLARQGEM